jgi:hypothetical protein
MQKDKVIDTPKAQQISYRIDISLGTSNQRSMKGRTRRDTPPTISADCFTISPVQSFFTMRLTADHTLELLRSLQRGSTSLTPRPAWIRVQIGAQYRLGVSSSFAHALCLSSLSHNAVVLFVLIFHHFYESRTNVRGDFMRPWPKARELFVAKCHLVIGAHVRPCLMIGTFHLSQPDMTITSFVRIVF